MSEFPNEFPRRGEIYWAPGDKVRPMVVVSADHGNKFSGYVVVAAITRTLPEKLRPVNVRLKAGWPLPFAGEILCRTLYTLPKTELRGYRETLSEELLEELDAALATALALKSR